VEPEAPAPVVSDDAKDKESATHDAGVEVAQEDRPSAEATETLPAPLDEEPVVPPIAPPTADGEQPVASSQAETEAKPQADDLDETQEPFETLDLSATKAQNLSATKDETQ